MQAYWTDKKPDGMPITDGRLCRVVDLEDGSQPVRVYGRTQDEVFSKIERTMATAQATLGQVKENGRAQLPKNGNGAQASTVANPLPNPAILSPDETMRLTSDLSNPAKSADAAFRLAESERAKRDDAQQRYLAICKQWSMQNPQFFQHKANRQLLITKALLEVGNDISKITLEVLDDVYRYLEGRGDLLTENDVVAQAPDNSTVLPSEVQPGGSLESVPARPKNGVVTTTSHRSNRLGSPQQPQWKPKYTQAEISKLSTKDTDQILRGTHPTIAKKDYDEACEFYWPQRAQVTA